MTFSPRPHPSPCACQECIDWARAVAVVDAPKAKRIGPRETLTPEMPLADIARQILETACKATGLSEEELRARAEEMGESVLEPLLEQRVDRQTVAARGVPEIHLRAVYDAEPDECVALIAVREFLSSGKTVLVLSGGVGTCKTGSACWALTQKPGVFVTADEAVRLSTSNVTEDVEAWRRARNAQVLVIDDLGGEYAGEKGWNVRVFNGLLDHRYSSSLKTIMTTNLIPGRFRDDYGERVADRIREAGRWMTLGGTSVRRKA